MILCPGANPASLTKVCSTEPVFLCRNAGINELQNLKYLPRAGPEREIVFEDRTHAHADHVGFGMERQTTAAVGKK